MQNSPIDRDSKFWDCIVVIVLLSIVVISRWEALTIDYQLNFDESSFAAQGIRMLHGAIVPWKDLDAGSSSAMTPALAALLFAAGFPQDYITLHFLAAVLTCFQVLMLYWIARTLLTLPYAAAISALIASVVALARTFDFTHYAGELLPNSILIAALLCIVRSGQQLASWGRWSIAGSVLVGITPFAKLQFAPIACALMVFLGLEQLLVRNVPLGDRFGRILALAAASAAPGIVLLFWVAISGGLPDFYNSYLLTNLSWSPDPGTNRLAEPVLTVTWYDTFSLLNWVGVSLLLASFLTPARPKLRMEWSTIRSWALLLVLFFAAVYSVVRPLRMYSHHQWLLLAPFGFFAILAMKQFASYWDLAKGIPKGIALLAAFGIPCAYFVEPLFNMEAQPLAYFRMLALNPSRSPYSVVAYRTSKVAPDAKSLFVWGWSDALYLHTNLRPVSKFTCTVFLIEDYPARELMRTALINELEKDPPDVVIDTVAPGMLVYPWKDDCRLSMLPELSRLVQRDYELAFEQPVKSRKQPVRIYVRKK